MWGYNHENTLGQEYLNISHSWSFLFLTMPTEQVLLVQSYENFILEIVL